MKNLKHYTGSLLLICLTILAGCSDNLTAPASQTQNLTHEKNQLNKSEAVFDDGIYRGKFKLSPGQTINLHYGITNLLLINSYSVSNCSFDRNELMIRTSNMIGSNSLPCEWTSTNGLMFEDLSIKNVSGNTKIIEVKMTGFTFQN